MDYFERHDIAWWGGGPGPTDSPISSQVACVNHLEPARVDRDVALEVLRSVLPEASDAVAVEDGGYIAYEWIGGRNYLGERGDRRGAHRTSLDAVMVAEDSDRRTLVAIEWKYTESYPAARSVAVSNRGTSRIEIYRPLLDDPRCPIAVPSGQIEDLFYEPLYQLARQTLLAWQMVAAGEFGASDWLHIHVIPEGNEALLRARPSPGLPGRSLSEVWRSVLREPARYRVVAPTSLLPQVMQAGRWSEWRSWLAQRYGT